MFTNELSWWTPKLLFSSEYFLIFIVVWLRELFRSVVLHFLTFGDFLVIFPLLSFMWIHSGHRRYTELFPSLSILETFPTLWPRTWSVLMNMPCILENIIYSPLVRCDVFNLLIVSVWLIGLVQIFCILTDSYLLC